MGKLGVFNFISLNGYYKDAHNGYDWGRPGEEENEFSKEGASGGGILLFGRVTYELMSSYWPSPAALESNPVVANGMNKAEKFVFSKTLKKAEWNNTTLLNGDLIEEAKKLKQTAKKDMTILGSGSIISQLADAGLIDTYQIMIHPVALGAGTTLFSGMKHKLNLKLTNSRIFKSGVIVLSYEPLK